MGEPSCSNGIDDDCDGRTDEEDADCGYLYQISRASSPPEIDGNCAEYEAATSLVLQRGPDNYAVFRLLWDDLGLYFCGWAADGSLDAAATDPEADHDASIWRDDSIELMFDTDNDAGPNLATGDYKLLISVANVTIDRDGLSYDWNPDWTSSVRLRGTLNEDSDVDESYAAEGSIAWEAWDADIPQVGTPWRGEFIWNDRDSFLEDDRVSQIWSNRGYHANSPDGWGDLLFVE